MSTPDAPCATSCIGDEMPNIKKHTAALALQHNNTMQAHVPDTMCTAVYKCRRLRAVAAAAVAAAAVVNDSKAAQAGRDLARPTS